MKKLIRAIAILNIVSGAALAAAGVLGVIQSCTGGSRGGRND